MALSQRGREIFTEMYVRLMKSVETLNITEYANDAQLKEMLAGIIKTLKRYHDDL